MGHAWTWQLFSESMNYSNVPKTTRKIVFLSANEWLPWSGSEYLWSAAAGWFARRGARVIVSVKQWNEPVKQVENLRALGCHVVYRPPLSLAKRAIQNFIPDREYRRHIKQIASQADLVVISQGKNMDGLPWMEAARSSGLKYAIIAQTAAEDWWPDDEFALRAAVAYEHAAAVYFVSEANLVLSRLQFASPLAQAKVVRNPFNVSYTARAAWPSHPEDSLALACVGRLDIVQKRQDLLIQVLSLPHWRSRKVRISLVGQGVNELTLRRLVDMMNLKNIDFTGFVDDIETLWSRHHALILPSQYEGMPVALVEAMLCGRAGIVTDVAGNRELVRDGINGFLAKAPTLELLDDAMNRAWTNRGSLMEMGRVAAEDVRKWVPEDPGTDFARELDTIIEQ